MKRFSTVLVVLLLALLASACGVTIVTGSGKVVSQPRSVSSFSAVTFGGLGDITITQGDAESLVVEAEDNVLTRIKSEVANGVLTIRFDTNDWRDMIRPTKPIRFILKVKNLTSIDFSGAGNVQMAGLKTSRLTLKISGAGTVKMDRLDAAEILTSMSGAASVDLSGQAPKQEVDISGAGNYGAGDLSSQTATVKVTGTGGATVWARDALEVTIGGAGSVSYYGNPKLTKNVTGIGILTPLGSK